MVHDLVTCPAGEEGEREHGEEDCGTLSAYDGRFVPLHVK